VNDKNITARKLVRKTINHQITHRVPKGELVLDDEIIGNYLKTGSVGFEEKIEFVNQFGLDLISLSPKYSKNGDFSIDCTEMQIDKWAQNTSLFTFVILDGAFEYGLRYFGFEIFFTMIMRDPEGTKDFISQVEKLNLETASRLADDGLDGIIIADDIAYQNGLLIRPSSFCELFLPSLEKQIRVIEERQMVPFFHSDGNYLAVIEDIIDIGFKGIHCIDKKCGVNLKKLAPYSDKLCLWGHLDVDDLHSSQDVAMMTHLIDDIKTATAFKGFILGTNSGLFSGIDLPQLQNIHTNVDVRSSLPGLHHKLSKF